LHEKGREDEAEAQKKKRKNQEKKIRSSLYWRCCGGYGGLALFSSQ
jgi:hypothetical protein